MLNLNLERYGRLALNGTEQSKLQLGSGVWERAVPTTTAKGALATMQPTRVVRNLFDRPDGSYSSSDRGSISVSNQVITVNYQWSSAWSIYKLSGAVNSNSIAASISQMKSYAGTDVLFKAGETYIVKLFDSTTDYNDLQISNATTNMQISDGVAFTPTEDFNALWVRTQEGTHTAGNHTFKVMIVEGSTAPSGYYPYFSPSTVLSHAKVFGRTVQSGTPSPTSPVDINGVGDRTVNLFSSDTSDWKSGTYHYIKVCEEGEDAYLTLFEKDPTVSLDGVYFGFTRNGKDATGGTVVWHIDDGRVIDLSKNNNRNNIKYAYISVYGRNGFADAMDKLTRRYNIMAVKSSTAPTEYIPYGYQVGVLLGSQGVVDLGSLSWSINNNSRISADISDIKIPSSNAVPFNGYCEGFRISDYNSPTSATSDHIIANNNLTNGIALYLHEAFAGKTTTEVAQMLSGKYLYYQRTTDPTWQPPTPYTFYTDRQLNAISTYEDVLTSNNDGTGSITGNIGVKVLDGVTDGLKFTSVSSLSTFYYSSIPQDGITQNMSIFCTHFKNKNALENYVCYAGNNGITFHHSFSALEDANAWLASEYTEGHPVIVYFPLATSATTQLTGLPVISLTEKTQYTLENENTVRGDMSAEYLGA